MDQHDDLYDEDELTKIYDREIFRRLIGYVKPYTRRVLVGLVLILIASIVWAVVSAQETKRKQLESGSWIENLPAAEYQPSRGILELKIDDLPPAPVKPSAINAPSATP